jgi:type IV fimbrial biogenesis protein FimT
MYGFSLIELMVVIAIVGILVVISAPSFSTLLQRQRMTTTVNELFAAINLTRSEAIQRGARVDLVPADGVDWSNGWVVFIDQDGDQKVDTGEKIIFSHGAVPAGFSITSRFTDNDVKYVAYNGAGRTHTNANRQTAQAGRFHIVSTSARRDIVLNFMGRPRTCVPTGSTLTC